MKTLKQLLPELMLSSELASLTVRGMSQDSRLVKPGDMYCAVAGVQGHGEDYIEAAIKRGAVVVALEAERVSEFTQISVPIVAIENLGSRLSELAGRLYDHPSRSIDVVGVTGTNGKSSVVWLLASCLNQLGRKAGMIGTLGAGFADALTFTGLTTPDPCQTQKLLRDCVDAGAEMVVMEVSSHALSQGRVTDVRMPYVGYTNLSRDHLDYHGSMEAYAQTKRKIFDQPGVQAASINIDDVYGAQWAEQLKPQLKQCVYGLRAQATLRAEQIEDDAQGLRFLLVGDKAHTTVNTCLTGWFNVMNMLTVASILKLMDVPLVEIGRVLSAQATVPGRMQTLNFGEVSQPRVVVDFAHTPEALELALDSLRPSTVGKLWVVFGCGGDRDRGKRPMMLSIAQRLSDHVIITADNPRTECFDQIVQDMRTGWDDALSEVQVIEDRERAVRTAIRCAQPQDTILLAGKGHETGQIIGTDYCPYCEIDFARDVLASM